MDFIVLFTKWFIKLENLTFSINYVEVSNGLINIHFAKFPFNYKHKD